ncbi:MgtC/SapB family protein [Microvirga sp. M2]|uniref:MgtC/SapB family protein n=1 Tax=Microvirga sp. M2 TaxID=3073270 RepID=UPI0039C2F41C
MEDWFEPILRLAAATVAGAIVGINRDLYGKPTGVRLHALVTIGSALLVMLPAAYDPNSQDPAAASRIIQGIVGGIGFLGAGVILRATTGERVYHITTAATIWVTAALGIACGLGAWRLALLAAVLVLLVLTGGLALDRRLHRRSTTDDLDEAASRPEP